MQRGWESGTRGLRPGTEMGGGVLLSRPRPYMGCSTWESVSQYIDMCRVFVYTVMEENCAVLDYYAASISSSLPTFQTTSVV